LIIVFEAGFQRGKLNVDLPNKMDKMMTNRSTYIKKLFFLFILFSSFGFSQKEDERELRRLNAKIDRIRVQVDSLELDNQILLPELMSAFKQAVKTKAQQDSVTLVVLKRINTLSNKISNLENQSRYMDSTALEIFNKLVLVENKIVTLANSYNEMAKLKSGSPISNEPRFNSAQYKQTYMESLGHFQNQEFDDAIEGFKELVSSDPTNELADNSQYWLAECYYSQQKFKIAIAQFEKVFTYAGTDKDDDAQLKIGLSFQSMGNVKKAREEFQRLIDYFPGSEYYPKAKESLKQLSIN
jgi:tol-pal system protein YbgF|tara:strand:+ start:1641 stop:2534 length:894 start_codon:yes stop_codon:yes gene_type:complete